MFSWQLLTASPHPSPNTCLSFYRVEPGDQGKPRWRMVDNGALLVQLTSNESTDSARTQLDLSVKWLIAFCII